MTSPIECWNERLKTDVRRKPPTQEELDKFAGIECQGRIQSTTGLQKDTVEFNSTQLHDLLVRLQARYEPSGEKVPKICFWFNQEDIHKITVINPLTTEVFFVPARDPRIKKGMSLAEYKSMKKGKASRKPRKDFGKDSDKLDELRERSKEKAKTRKANKPKKKLPPVTAGSKRTPEMLDQLIAEGTQRYTGPQPDIPTPEEDVDTIPKTNNKPRKYDVE